MSLFEVYYDDAGKPTNITRDPVAPGGDTLEEVRSDLEHMLDALKKPVLNYDDF